MIDLWPDLRTQIPDILATQDPGTGRFGTEPFIVNDQNVMWPLAVAWATEPADGRENPYHHDPRLLDAIIAAGDALIEVADADGMFEFRKKDNSTWGQIHMPWTYSRWIRAWGVIRDAMPDERRETWDAALTLACDRIIAQSITHPVRNIPAHHAMGVYRASQVLGREDWQQAAVDYLHQVVDDQDPGGFWSEHHGPVVRYNFVYVDVLGCYYGMSGDAYVLPALERAAEFHAGLTYPDRTPVETVDERNPYGHRSASENVGFPAAISVGFFAGPIGRGYQRWLIDAWRAAGDPVPADIAASIVAYGQHGHADPPIAELPERRFVVGDGDALVQRSEPWFVALSTYHGQQAPPRNRWIQDRQAHLSIFHDQVGLVLSGSNTRLQPRWSTFTVGDVALLAQHPGDEDPDFSTVPGLEHLPSSVRLAPDGLGIDLVYGEGVGCTVRIELPDTDGGASVVRYGLTDAADREVAAHAGFIAHVGEPWRAGDHHGVLDERPIRLTGRECGGRFSHHGWHLELPDDAVVAWPVRGHDPYTKDGSSAIESARIVVTLPLGTTPATTQIAITVDTKE